jgi:hypothetical protein
MQAGGDSPLLVEDPLAALAAEYGSKCVNALRMEGCGVLQLCRAAASFPLSPSVRDWFARAWALGCIFIYIFTYWYTRHTTSKEKRKSPAKQLTILHLYPSSSSAHAATQASNPSTVIIFKLKKNTVFWDVGISAIIIYNINIVGHCIG